MKVSESVRSYLFFNVQKFRIQCAMAFSVGGLILWTQSQASASILLLVYITIQLLQRTQRCPIQVLYDGFLRWDEVFGERFCFL